MINEISRGDMYNVKYLYPVHANGILETKYLLTCLQKLLDGPYANDDYFAFLQDTFTHTHTHTHKCTQPIVITPEGNQYWLSTEDVLAKGVPEDEVENFK